MLPLPPQFFDIFGFCGFVYITAVAWLALRGISLPKWIFIILLLVGIIGLMVDGFVVYEFYLK
jgi:multidrug transporter EmrE-like cation transporter